MFLRKRVVLGGVTVNRFRYGVIGSFSFGKDVFGGQSIKTRNFANALEETLGEKSVLRIDTRNWKKTPINLVRGILKALKESTEIVILPAMGGLSVIPFLVFFLKGTRKRKLHYVVIGGWLAEQLKKKPHVSKILKKYNGIYVETSVMKRALEELGFNNVVVLPNFKTMPMLKDTDMVCSAERPFKLCTFSRILKEKGIEDAINAVKAVNEKFEQVIYELDIYGRIDPLYEERFLELVSSFPPYICYKGVAENTKSTELLRNYYALVFPTQYYTEGIPGTIIDAYFSGIPVIASKWESFEDVIEDGKTGIGYELGNTEALISILERLLETPEILNRMKQNCLVKAKDFTAKKAMEIFICSHDEGAKLS